MRDAELLRRVVLVLGSAVGLGSSGRRGRRGDDGMASRDRRERVMLLARDLRRIGTAPALQFEMVADGVLEVAHADSLTRLRTL